MKRTQKKGLTLLIVGLIIILITLVLDGLLCKWDCVASLGMWGGGYAEYAIWFFLIIGSILIIIGLVYLVVSTRSEKIEYPFEKKRDWKSVAGRLGPVIILIEGIFFIIEGLASILFIGYYSFFPYYLLMGGIVAIVGIYSGYRKNKYARIICFIAGTLALVSLILLFPPWWGYYGAFILIYLGYFLLDKILLILFFIGGILCLISGDRFLNYYLDIIDFKQSSKK